MNDFTDRQLLDGIRDGNQTVLKFAFQTFKPMAIHITHDPAEANSVLSEVIESIWRRLQKGPLDIHCKLSTYLFRSIWQAWSKKQRRPKALAHQLPVEHLESAKYAERIDEDFEKTERSRLVWESLEKLGETCKKLLFMAFAEDRPNDEIVEAMQFSSDGFFRKKKTECKGKLIELARKDPRFAEFLNL